ncbi:MAG: LacI family DNA-binding transcriptional regulator [Treponemataceae bacterium]
MEKKEKIVRAEGRITLKHVAEDAGVSRSTVSLVLRGGTNLADETVQRVIGSIQKLGYVYNRAAASLRTNRSNTVGLLVPNIQNPVFAEILVGAEEKLNRIGMTLLLTNTGESLDRQKRALTLMHEHGVEGILICPVRGTKGRDIAPLLAGTPTVFLTRYLDDFPCNYIGIDNSGGIAAAMDHLFNLGHRRIAFAGGYADTSSFRDRSEAVLTALRERGLPAETGLLFPSNISTEGGEEMVNGLLAVKERPSAIVCFNDLVALGLMIGLKRHGLQPGRDISVIGFDDMPISSALNPALTTVRAETIAIGHSAAELLESLIEEGEAAPRRIILPTTLVVRESTWSCRKD